LEDDFVIEINTLGVKKTKAIIDEYNSVLNGLKLTLQANFGTSNINSAISIAVGTAALNVGIEIVEAILTLGMSEVVGISDYATSLTSGPIGIMEPTFEVPFAEFWRGIEPSIEERELERVGRMLQEVERLRRRQSYQDVIDTWTEAERRARLIEYAKEVFELSKQSKLSGGGG